MLTESIFLVTVGDKRACSLDARLVLPTESLELMARKQSTLDNQLYKALRALRGAQEWRLKTLEGVAATSEIEDLSTTV